MWQPGGAHVGEREARAGDADERAHALLQPGAPAAQDGDDRGVRVDRFGARSDEHVCFVLAEAPAPDGEVPLDDQRR